MTPQIIWIAIVAIAVLAIFLHYAYKVGRESQNSRIHSFEITLGDSPIDEYNSHDDDDQWDYND